MEKPHASITTDRNVINIEIEELIQEEVKSVKHFINGAMSGMVGVFLSHPFDTMKTRIQDGLPVNATSLRSLYRGFLPPLIGVGFEKAVVFGVYLNSSNELQKRNYSSLAIQPIAGAIAGLSASLIVTPVERIKIMLQTGQSIHAIEPRTLFRGLSATFTRETPGFAIYFSVYESLKSHFYTSRSRDISTSSSFLFGGIAGAISWLFIFPQDCIKTRMQAATSISSSSSSSSSSSFMSVVRDIYRLGGLKMFYRGFHFALMRAVPLHAGTFATMELLKKYHK